ncbi:MAG TPA: phage tail tube protein [Burkholderiaceae bacterium]|nr:phage tail tube protein [Burkholderiaceae bacterium]
MSDILLRSAILLAKKETTYGTSAAPTVGANAILMSKPDITPLDGTRVKHDYVRNFLGNSGGARVSSYAHMKFSVEAAGSGTAGTAPAYSALLLACGTALTTVAITSCTYTPVSSGFDSVTLVFNIDGQNHQMTGARGTFQLKFDAEALPYFEFDFTGLFSPLTYGVPGTAVLTAFKDAVGVNKANTTCALHTRTMVARSLTLNAANSVKYRNLVGLEAVRIGDRQSTGDIEFLDDRVDQKDWVKAAQDGDKGALSWVHGTTAGNIITVASPAAQLGGVSYGDIDGFRSVKSQLDLCSGASGNDEWSIAFT